ncbi:hypothetical protein AB0M46_24045 [Dactylosporangium sp. NPDC051485]|uniref:hypothetical protein n=1 Tax=Dactylosporangium sp. NPDC051485 TaxID=3154846 RepID=UPI003446955D
MTRPLERRYRALLRLYPAAYRAERADEMVATYLELVSGNARWPSPADVTDLIRGAVRQHLRANGAHGLLKALPSAAALALTTATVISTMWLLGVDTLPRALALRDGSFLTIGALGAVTFGGWLVAGIAASIMPGRWGRWAVAAALVLTVTVMPVAALTSLQRPAMQMLVPQLMLGLLALALPAGRQVWPVLGVPIGALIVGAWSALDGWYPVCSCRTQPSAAVLLLLAGAVVAVVFVRRRDERGAYPLLLVLAPAGLFVVRDVATGLLPHAATPTWSMLATTAAIVTVVALAPVLIAVTMRGRRLRHPGDAADASSSSFGPTR